MNDTSVSSDHVTGSQETTSNSFMGELAFRQTHWALERTQLAWIRTAFALTGAGFALDKGTTALDRADLLETNHWVTGGMVGGVALSIIAALQLTIATVAYVRRERQLREFSRQPRVSFPLAFTLSISGIGFSLVVAFLLAVL